MNTNEIGWIGRYGNKLLAMLNAPTTKPFLREPPARMRHILDRDGTIGVY